MNKGPLKVLREISDGFKIDRLSGNVFAVQVREVGFDLDALKIKSML